MLDVQQAVDKALEFSRSLGQHHLPVASPLLEEVEMDEAEKNWLITLSFALPSEPSAFSPLEPLSPLEGRGALSELPGAQQLQKAQRAYRRFSVDRKNGKVISMKSVQVG